MKKINKFVYILAVYFFAFSLYAQQQYVVSSIKSSLIGMDSTWDTKVNIELMTLIKQYQSKLNAEMSIPIGTATQTLQKGYPQSLLTNFTADAMYEIGKDWWRDIDFAVINNGGLRSTINKGTITVGNMYEVYAFDNRLVLLELTGKAVKDFFNFVASNGGEGLSRNIHLIINNQNIRYLTIGGKSLDEDRLYRIVTVDYLAEGNGGMNAFRKAVRQIDSEKTLRDSMIQYIQTLTIKNLEANAKLDDRIIFINE